MNTAPTRKSIYLLPNLFTTGTIFGGFYAIVAASKGLFEPAAIAIFVAMVMDALDGRVARLTKTHSEFGMQYDSLADLVAFGVAPALVLYEWRLGNINQWGEELGRLGWLVAFVFIACAALRLARFNVQSDITDKRYFIGLPSPAAAALLVGTVWVVSRFDLSVEYESVIALLVTAFGAGLMVSNIHYYSFKQVDDLKRVPFFALPVVVLAFSAIALSASNVLYTVFLSYVLSGPILGIYHLLAKRKPAKSAAKKDKSQPKN